MIHTYYVCVYSSMDICQVYIYMTGGYIQLHPVFTCYISYYHMLKYILSHIMHRHDVHETYWDMCMIALLDRVGPVDIHGNYLFMNFKLIFIACV